jgi:hypothetical protein
VVLAVPVARVAMEVRAGMAETGRIPRPAALVTPVPLAATVAPVAPAVRVVWLREVLWPI